MKLLNLIVAVLLCASPLWAKDAGTTAADFLNLGVGPRAIAMGDAQTGLADDAYSAFTNPAGLTQLKTPEAAFAHSDYILGIHQEAAAYAYPHRRFGTLALTVNYLGYGRFSGYDAAGQPTSDVDASDTAFGLSYAHDLYREERYGSRLAAGVTGRWIQERLDTAKGTAMGTDVGLLFAPGIKWGELWNGLKAGLAVRNLGSSMTFDRDSFPLPRVMTAGLSYTGQWRNESFTLALDGRQPSSGEKSVGLGLEILTLQSFFIRGGYTTQGDLGNGLRVGAGVRFKIIQLDYAFTPEGPLGSAHRFGLTLRFAPPKENLVMVAQGHFDQGLKRYTKRRYTEALVEFNKTLELDPTHPQALEMMKKTYEAIRENANILNNQ